jgi:predicted nucleic acid-binding Zn ribbon protein
VRKRRAPRRARGALAAVVDALAPASGLGSLQRAWPEAVGEVIAAQAHPSAERDGVVTVTCSSSVWAQELTLMAPELTSRVNAAIGAESVGELRFRAAPAGAWSRAPSA